MNGNLKKKINKVSGAFQEYFWNAENQMTSAKSYRNSSLLEFSISYKYDPSGHRISRIVQNHIDPSKSYTRKYIYDGNNIVALLNENNEFIAGYMYDDGIDEPVVLVTDYNLDGELDAVSIVRDRQNSVKLLVNDKS